MDSFDAAIVGAGPAGCVAAIAFARRGARVALIEAHPDKHRFAGELLHSSGVQILEDLGITGLPSASQHGPCRGFAVFSSEQADASQLNYSGIPGLTFEHNALVRDLRAHATGCNNVTYMPHSRVTGITGQRATWKHADGKEGELTAGLIVGADGRFSATRRALGLARDNTVLSHMAGFILRNIQLPLEGYGHVVLGGPGPGLIYRISPTEVRVCLDVPVQWRKSGQRDELIWDAYRDCLPDSLRAPVREALKSKEIVWAINELQPRASYGRLGCALIGDAVGHFHPMTAIGITMALADAECLSRVGTVQAYKEERQRTSLSPAMLATALYEIFAVRSDATAALRQSIFQLWRNNPEIRARTMQFLSCSDTSLFRLMSVGLRMTGLATGYTAITAAACGQWGPGLSTGRRIGGLVHWLLYESVPTTMQFPMLRAAPTPFKRLRERHFNRYLSQAASGSGSQNVPLQISPLAGESIP